MKRTNKIIIGAIIISILLLGIGYAAIQNITLNISGTAKADPSQSNFKVRFTAEPVQPGYQVDLVGQIQNIQKY